jgi:hypothetical protein
MCFSTTIDCQAEGCMNKSPTNHERAILHGRSRLNFIVEEIRERAV